MRTFRESDGYIRHDFGYYDSGVIGALGPMIFTVYDVMRRFIWRDAERGNPDVVEMVKRGALPVRANQQTLAEYAGVSEKTVNRLLPVMERLGWIKRYKIANAAGRLHCYVLGEKVKDDKGREVEVFFADAWMLTVCKHLEREITRQYGEKKGLLSVPMADRIGIVKALLDPAGETDSESYSTRQGVQFNKTPSPVGETDSESARIPVPLGPKNTEPVIGEKTVPMGRVPIGTRGEISDPIQTELRTPTMSAKTSSPPPEGGGAPLPRFAVGVQLGLFDIAEGAGTSQWTQN